jgi:hypothetical protein
MKLQRTSLFLVLAAVAAGGTVYVAEQQKSAQNAGQSQSQSLPQTLFTVKEADIQDITVKTATQSLHLQRAADGSWTLQDVTPDAKPSAKPSVKPDVKPDVKPPSQRPKANPVRPIRRSWPI